MAGTIYAYANTRGFYGLSSIYQYVNADGQNPRTVCGQAASATLLTYCTGRPANLSTLRAIERTHPPDILGGILGTSPRRVQAILVYYGAIGLGTIGNEESLKRLIRGLFPVICLIQNSGGLFGLGDGAHWLVAFAYNDNGIFVTNYGNVFLSWSAWREKWNSPLPWTMPFKGITSGRDISTRNLA
jgi:hypothetical protein